MNLSEKQITMLRFYEGDIDEKNIHDPFYGDPKAYVTLNALLFDGLTTEKARVEENRILNPAFLKDPIKTADCICTILSTMYRSDHDMVVSRVERTADFNVFSKDTYMPSFISTSYAGFLSAYEDKHGLALMKIHIPQGTYIADMKKLLTSYLKEDEEEVLLPPYMHITVQKNPLDDSMKKIHDGYGNIPEVYADVYCDGFQYPFVSPVKIEDKDIENAEHLYHCLNAHEALSDADMESYMHIKQAIQYHVITWMRSHL